MKKMICALTVICMLLVSLTAAAFAQTVKPTVPETLRNLVAGKTLIGRLTGMYTDDAGNAAFTCQISEQETFKAEEIEALQAGDTLVVGGESFLIKEIKQDEFGYEAKGEDYTLFLSKNEDGQYVAVTDTENRFYRTLFTVEVPASSALRFLDWSDPEAEAPTELTLKDLVERYADLNSLEDNTEFTFDENAQLIQFTYRYSPWN